MKKLIQLIIVACSLAVMAGCDKILDVKSQSQITEQEYFKSEGDFDPYVTGIYIYLRGPAKTGPSKFTGMANNIVYGTERSEELINGTNSRLGQSWTQVITPTSGAVDNTDYNVWYKTIGNCNLLLSKIADFNFTNNDNKKRITAEALCIRAYTYFHMVRVIGDAVIMNDPVTDDNVPQLPRSKATDVMKQVFSDLDQAISLFPAKTITSKNHFSYPAAQAMKADAKLWSAKVLGGGTPDLNDAIAALAEVEKTSGLALRSNFKDVTTVRANEEIIMAAYFNRDESSANYGVNALPFITAIAGATNIDSIPYTQTSSNGLAAYQISNLSKSLFPSNDKRIPLTYIIERQGTTLKKSWITKLPGNKYADDRVSDNDIIIYRLADIYLMEAEAYAAIGNTATAITYLNKTRNRAGIGNYSGATDQLSVEKEILNERGRELFFENKRWFDLVRFHKGGTINVYNYVPNLIGKTTPLYWPLAPTVLGNNNQLTQTDGY